MAAEFFYSSVAKTNTLAVGIDGSATSASLSTAPVGYPSSFPFKAAWDFGTPSEEIVYVTNLVGSTVTMTRGREGTAGVSHDVGAEFRHIMTGLDLQTSRDHEDATAAHGVATVAGLTETQSLTNKTIDGASNTFQNVPQTAITDLLSDQATQDGRLTTNEGNISSVTTDVSNHINDQTGVHGVGEVVGRTEAQTLTNKTIDGDNNTLQDIDYSSIDRIIWAAEGDDSGDGTVGPGDEVYITTLDTIASVNDGGTVSSGAFSAEKIVPVTGLYRVTAHQNVRRQSSSVEAEARLRVRVGGSAGTATDGTVKAESVESFGTSVDADHALSLHIDKILLLSASSRVKFTLVNGSGAGSITKFANDDDRWASIEYLGPA